MKKMKTQIKKYLKLLNFKLLLILLSISIPLISLGQWECFTTQGNADLKIIGIGCDNWYNYVNYPNSNNLPIKTVRVAFHIIQDGNGNGNFQDLEADKNFLNNIIELINDKLSNLSELTIFGQTGQVASPYIKDCRIRVYLDAIYFHKDAELWDFSSNIYNKVSQAYNRWVVNNNNIDDIGKNHTLNIIVGGNYNIPGGHVSDIGGYQYIGMRGFYAKLDSLNYNPWVCASVLCHEMGHSFGLNHNFHGTSPYSNQSYGYQCDDCDDNDPAGLPCPIVSTSNNIMDYSPGGGGGFSVCQAGKMLYFLSGQSGTISQDVIIDCNSNIVTYIDQNTEINSNYIFPGDVLIKEGKVLSIKCKVSLLPTAKIVVMRGAKLIVDGGTITSACNNMWKGVEIWGTSSAGQNDLTAQGVVELKNGATIENARTAIATCKTINNGDIDWGGYFGGIIRASNANFINNMRAVSFMTYKNKLPNGNEIDNRSYFDNCIFETNAPLLDEGTDPNAFVTLWEVRGVKFTRCTFRNTNPIVNIDNQLGTGIYAIDANVSVTGKCNVIVPIGQQCNNYNPNTFSNLQFGIRCINIRGGYNYVVDRNLFDNCIYGVVNDGVDYSSITRNSFNFGTPSVSYMLSMGICFNTGKGFSVEENSMDFTGNESDNRSIGIWMNNTGPYNNRVYKNTLNNLMIGNLANGNNRKNDPENGKFLGLHYDCNDHNTKAANSYDIAVVTQNNNDDGIRLYQGDLSNNGSYPAANLFSKNGSNTESDIFNQSPWPVIYYYFGTPATANREYPEYISSNVNPSRSYFPNTCPSSFEQNTIGRLTADTRLQMETKYLVNNQAYHNYYNLYRAMLDGGNTQELCYEINSSWPEDMWELRAKLLGESPYLSEKALILAAEKDQVLPNSILFEILLANPDALKNENFLKYLLEKPNPLPEWMVIYLKDNSETITARSLLEAQLSYYLSQRDDAINLIIGDILSDTNGIDHIQLRGWLANLNNVNADYSIVEDMLALDETEQAQIYLESITQRYKLSDEETIEYNNYYDFFIKLTSLISESKNIMQLSTDDLIGIQELAENGKGPAKIKARNLLTLYGSDYVPDPMLPNGSNTKRLVTREVQEQIKQNTEPYFSVYPNPAKNWINYTWRLPVSISKASLVISDVNANPVYNMDIFKPIGQQVVDIRKWDGGTYIYSFITNGKDDIKGKFIISK